MSSMRNAVTRRPHRERSQPDSRAKWGLLEKHKDYSLRAKDYNQKKAKLNILSEKSKEKHPDEFNFGMVRSAQGKRGQRSETENRLSHDAVKLLKTQDAGYLRNVAQRTRRELEKAEQEVGMDVVLKRVDQGNERKVVFGDNGEPVRKRRRTHSNVSLDVDEVDMLGDLDNEGLDSKAANPITRPEDDSSAKPIKKVLSRKQAEKERDRLAQLKADRKRRKRLQELRTAKLEVLKKRQREIMAAADQLDLQRAKMAKVIGGTNKSGVKFKVRERKS